ncbi:MAG: hypothetical protein IPK50_15760 [Fibrobacterota bacterium]|nr:MAG: hypothetical protein IPK50_15760 [Fibrobacterota bacterium]
MHFRRMVLGRAVLGIIGVSAMGGVGRIWGSEVHYIQEGAGSERFELAKLVDGEISGVFTVEGRSGFVVKAGRRFLRFDAQGRLLDLAKSDVPDDRGNEFDLISPETDTGAWRISHCQWLASGDHGSRELLVERISHQDARMLDDVLSGAQRIVPLQASSSNAKTFRGIAVWTRENWIVYDLSHWEESAWYGLPIRTETVKDRDVDLWHVHGWQGRPSDPLLRLATSSQDFSDSTLKSLDFSRRSVEFHEGLLGWVLWNAVGRWFLSGLPGQPPYAYWGGVGTFAFQYGGEQLRFRATASLGEPGAEGVKAENLRLLELPGGIRLLRVYAPGTKNSLQYSKEGLDRRAHDEVGLYVVRSRDSNSEVALPRSWVPEVEGLTWGTWDFPTGSIRFQEDSEPMRAFAQVPASVAESQDGMPRGGRLLPQPLRQRPHSLSYRLPVRYGQYPSSLAIELGESRWAFLAHEEEAPTLDVMVDSCELSEVWNLLASHTSRLVASFALRKEKVLDGERDLEWIEPSLNFVSGSKRIELKRCRWVAQTPSMPVDRRYRRRYLKSRAWQVGILARGGKSTPATWMETIREVLDEPQILGEEANWVVYVTNELLNSNSSDRNAPALFSLIDFWIEEIFPKLESLQDPGLDQAKNVLTSNCLGIAVASRDQERARKIIHDLVGPDAKSIAHGTLQYNLACYHAWKNDKGKLLEATRRALALGKSASQFREDADFAPWLGDRDFANLLGDSTAAP